MPAVTQHNATDPEGSYPVDAQMTEFYEHMIVDLGRSKTTARVRRTIVACTLRDLKTLEPSPPQIDKAVKRLILDGKTRDHARNFVFAFRDYFAFRGIKLPLCSHRKRDKECDCPRDAVKVPAKAQRKVPRYLTQDQVAAFLSVVEDPRDLALFSFLAYTGLRCHEVLKIKPEDVDLESRKLTILGKGGKSAVIPIGAPAIPVLFEYMEKHRDPRAETLFYARGDGGKEGHEFGPMSDNRMRVLARRYGKRAGIKHMVSPHQFRHALATNLLENGCPLPFVQRQLRHSRVETTMIYLHASDKAHRENFDRFLPDYGGTSA